MTSMPQPAAEASTQVDLGWTKRNRQPARAEAGEVAGSGSLGVALLVIAAVAARLMVMALGPMNDAKAAYEPGSEALLKAGAAVHERGSLHGLEVAMQGETMPLPGYPALLASVEGLGVGVHAVLLLQVIASAATVWLVYMLTCSLLKSARCGLVAAAVVALHPAAIVASVTVSPAAVVALLTIAPLTVLADRERADFAGAVLAGLCLGAAALMMPMSLAVGLAVAAWGLLHGRRVASIGTGVAFAAASLAPAAGWMARNHLVGLPLWPHGVSYWGDAATHAALPWSEPLAMGKLALGYAASHGLSDLFSRLALAGPQGLEADLTGVLMTTTPWAYAGAEAAKWLAVAWTGVNLLLAGGAVLGAAMLFLRGWWSGLALAAGLLAYNFATWSGADAERARVPVLGLQAILVAGVAMPGLKAAVVGFFARFKARRAAGKTFTYDTPEAPEVARSGRPL